jgi:hypothetical protein
LISTVSSTFLDAENLMVGDFETLERWIGRVIFVVVKIKVAYFCPLIDDAKKRKNILKIAA